MQLLKVSKKTPITENPNSQTVTSEKEEITWNPVRRLKHDITHLASVCWAWDSSLFHNPLFPISYPLHTCFAASLPAYSWCSREDYFTQSTAASPDLQETGRIYCSHSESQNTAKRGAHSHWEEGGIKPRTKALPLLPQLKLPPSPNYMLAPMSQCFKSMSRLSL